jgi:WD40 repeat protein
VVAFAPDGKTVLTGSHFGAHLWGLDGKQFSGFEIDGAIKSVAFAPDGNTVLVGYDGSKIAANLFDLQGNSIVTFSTDDPNHGEPYTITNTVAFSPDRRTIMVGSSRNNIQLFDSEGNSKENFNLADFLNYEEGSWTAVFSPDGTKIPVLMKMQLVYGTLRANCLWISRVMRP